MGWLPRALDMINSSCACLLCCVGGWGWDAPVKWNAIPREGPGFWSSLSHDRAGSQEDSNWLPHLPLPLRSGVCLGAGLTGRPGKAVMSLLTASRTLRDWTGLHKTLWKYKPFAHYVEFPTQMVFVFSFHPAPPLAVFLSHRHYRTRKERTQKPSTEF